MIGLLQRVREASVAVENQIIARIDQGLLVFIGIEKSDSEINADRLLERLLGYRVFSDDRGKMNLSLIQIRGSLLLVPQFTLPADTRKGMRPSFSRAADPVVGENLFGYLIEQARKKHQPVSAGQFGAEMEVALINDGPVTFWLQV